MKPLAGKLIIKTHAARKENEGGIIIPQKARQIQSAIGLVVQVTPYPVGSRQRIRGRKRKITISQARYDADSALIGQSVLLAEGQQFRSEDGATYVSSYIEHVEAIVDQPKEVAVTSDRALPTRCPRCKSAGISNLLLDDKGYCPNCNLNPAGEHRDSYDHRKVSDDASDHMAGRTSRDNQRRKDGVAEHGKIISYAGQTNHSALKTKKQD